MVVLITDGRANISLARSNEDPDAIGPDAKKPTGEELKEEVSIEQWPECLVGARVSAQVGFLVSGWVDGHLEGACCAYLVAAWAG